MHASKSSISRETPDLVIKSIFKRYDEDQDGSLNLKEFSYALDDLGIVDEYEQAALFALADADNSKTIEYDEFLQLIKGHDFECLLSNRDDYLFVIETYKTFQEYDIDGDGEVSWNEFYHYLSGHGYSHEYISQYWHYLDDTQTLTITFDEFWKGFKAQAEALKQQALHQQMTEQLLGASDKAIAIDDDYYCASPTTPDSSIKRRATYRARLLGGAKHQRIKSLIGNKSYRNQDKNNIFRVMKRHLKKTKPKKRSNALRLGRVVESDDSDESDEDDDSEDSDDGGQHLGPPPTLHVKKSISMDDMMVDVAGLLSSDADSIDDDDMDSSELLDDDDDTSSYDSDSLDPTDSESISLDVLSDDDDDDILMAMTQDIMRLGRDLDGNQFISKSQDDIKKSEDDEEDDIRREYIARKRTKNQLQKRRENEIKMDTNDEETTVLEDLISVSLSPKNKDVKAATNTKHTQKDEEKCKKESVEPLKFSQITPDDEKLEKISTKHDDSANEERKASEVTTAHKSTANVATETKEDRKTTVSAQKTTQITGDKPSDTKTSAKLPQVEEKKKNKQSQSSKESIKEKAATKKEMKPKMKSIVTPNDLKSNDDQKQLEIETKIPKSPKSPIKSVYIKRKKPKTPRIQKKISADKTKEKANELKTLKQTEKNIKTTTKTVDKPTEKATKPKTPKISISAITKGKEIKTEKKSTAAQRKEDNKKTKTKSPKIAKDKQTEKATKDKTKLDENNDDTKEEPLALAKKEPVASKPAKQPVKSVYIKKKKRKSQEIKADNKSPTKNEAKTTKSQPIKSTKNPVTTSSKLQPKIDPKPADKTGAKPQDKIPVQPKKKKSITIKTGEAAARKSAKETPKESKTPVAKSGYRPKRPSRSKLKLKRAASGDLTLLRRMPQKRKQRRRKRGYKSTKTGPRIKHKNKIEKIDTKETTKPIVTDPDFVFVSTPPAKVPPAEGSPAKSELKIRRSDSKEIKVSEATAVVISEQGETSKEIETKQVGEEKAIKKKKAAKKAIDKTPPRSLLKPKKRSLQDKRQSTPNFIRHNKLKRNAPKQTLGRYKKKSSKKRLKVVADNKLPTFRHAASNEYDNKLSLTPGAPSSSMKKKSKHKMAHSAQAPDVDLDALIDSVLSPKESKSKPDKSAYRKRKKSKKHKQRKSKIPKYAIKRRGSLDLDTESVAIHKKKSDKNVIAKKKKRKKRSKQAKLHKNYRVKLKEEKIKEVEENKKVEEEEKKEESMICRSQTERKPPVVPMRKKKKVRIVIPVTEKKAGKKRVTFSGKKVSNTLQKLRVRMGELNKKQKKQPKHKIMTPRDIRRKTKKSDYIQKQSVGRGFDLFKNYRVKTKEHKQEEDKEQLKIQSQLRERKKSLVKPSKLDKKYKKKGEIKYMKQEPHNKIHISSPFENKLSETMYDKRPSLRTKRAKINTKGKQNEKRQFTKKTMILIDEHEETEFVEKKKKKTKNVDNKSKEKVQNKETKTDKTNSKKIEKKEAKKITQKEVNKKEKKNKQQMDNKEKKEKKEEKKKGKDAKQSRQETMNQRRAMGDGKNKKKKRRGHKRVNTKHGSWELDKVKQDLGSLRHLDIEEPKEKINKRKKKSKRSKPIKTDKTDDCQSQTEKQLAKRSQAERRKKVSTNHSATEKKTNKKKKCTKEGPPPPASTDIKLKSKRRKLSYDEKDKKTPSKLKLRRALSSDMNLMNKKSLNEMAKGATKKKRRRKPRATSPQQSARKRSPSPAVSPKQSPRFKRKQAKSSPKLSQKQSANEPPNINRPKSSKNSKYSAKKSNNLALNEPHNQRSKSSMGLHARKMNVKRGRSDVEVGPRSRKKNKEKKSIDSDNDRSAGAYSIKVKVVFNKDIRRWRYHNQCNLAALRSFAAMSFNVDTFHVQYEDDEGDVLTLHNENDLYDAFECAEEEDRKSLKIYVAKTTHQIRKAKTQREAPPKSKKGKGNKKKSMEVKLNVSRSKKGSRKRANSDDDQIKTISKKKKMEIMDEEKESETMSVTLKKEKKGKAANAKKRAKQRSHTTFDKKNMTNGTSKTERIDIKNENENDKNDSSISRTMKLAKNIKKRFSTKSKNGKTKRIVKR